MHKKIITSKLSDFRVAVLATSGFEETELTEPVKALRKAGAQVTIVSSKPGPIQGVRHDIDKTLKIKVDRVIRDVSAAEFDAVHLPGGTVNADSMRMVPEVQAFLREMQDDGKPITAICHAPWELVSAGLVHGRTLTGYHTIQDDVRNAGGRWTDREVVEDGNWVTSRQPGDLPAFNRAMINLFSRSRRPGPGDLPAFTRAMIGLFSQNRRSVRHLDKPPTKTATRLERTKREARKDGSI